MNRYATDAWLTAFRHESGHAVAALSRMRPVKEILLNAPFDGFTFQGCKDTPEIGDDHEFVLWSGPWAEARTANELAGVTDAVPTVGQVRGFLEKNAGDRGAYFEAIEGKAPPSEAQWGDVLDGLWSEIKTLAEKLRNLDDVVELGHDQPALHRVDDRPTHWRRKEWILPDDYVDEWMEELHSGLGEPV